MNKLKSFFKRIDEDQKRPDPIIWILIIAFLFRLFVYFSFPLETRYQKDAVEYVSVAENILDNGVFGKEGGIPYAKIPPGYPYFIAGIFTVLGNNINAVRFSQVIISVGVVWLVYFIGKIAFNKQVALLSGLICALYPPFVFYVNLLLTETLYSLFALVFIYFFINTLKNFSLKQTFLMGIGFSFALYVKESLFAFPIMFPICFWWSRYRLSIILKNLIVFIAVVLFFISPWLARNYLIYNFVFFTSRIHSIRDTIPIPGFQSPGFKKPIEEENSDIPITDELLEYYEQYGQTRDLWDIEFAVRDPGTYLRFVMNRLIEFWLHPNGLQSLPPSVIIRGFYISGHIVILSLAIWQTLINLRRRDSVTGGLVMILIYISVVGIFFRRPIPRYNLPFLPIIFIYFSQGILNISNSIFQERE